MAGSGAVTFRRLTFFIHISKITTAVYCCDLYKKTLRTRLKKVLTWVLKPTFEIAFKYSGAVTGLTFNKLKINEKEWRLDGLIYPQIRIATFSSINNDIIYLIPKYFPIVGNHDSITTVINDDMNRPTDYGIFERLEILLEVSKGISNKERSNLIILVETHLTIMVLI